jgi:CheY-like chemotaxis protein
MPAENIPKILIVDDLNQNRVMIKSLLENMEVDIHESISGEDALEECRAHNFAVILLDLKLPGINGYETTTIIQQQEKSQKTPILILTAHHIDMNDQLQGDKVGACDYLLKPIIPEILQAKVAFFIDLFNKSQEIKQQSIESTRINKDLDHRFRDIQQLNRELLSLNERLNASLNEVKQLRGIIPICAYCKNIRTDHNYWEQVENYISNHSNLKFSHGICPTCYDKHLKPHIKQTDNPDEKKLSS